MNTLKTLAAGATAVVQHGLTVAITGRLIVGQLVSPGAAEALRVDRLKQQPVARALVQQVVDREQHRAGSVPPPGAVPKGAFTPEGNMSRRTNAPLDQARIRAGLQNVQRTKYALPQASTGAPAPPP